MHPADQHDNPYDLLAENLDDHHRWAFGTGFVDPLEGVDTSVPDGIDAAALATYSVMLGDDALVYSHRLQQWITRMPELEEETAIANIALDLLGQARMLLTRAVKADPALVPPSPVSGEDRLAFFREAHEFRNVRLVERADGRLRRARRAAVRRVDVAARTVRTTPPVSRSGARGDRGPRRQRAAPTTATTPPAGSSRSATAPSLAPSACRPRLTAIWPYVDELFTHTPGRTDARRCRRRCGVCTRVVRRRARHRHAECQPGAAGRPVRSG